MASADVFGFSGVHPTVWEECTVVGYYTAAFALCQGLAYVISPGSGVERISTSSLLVWLPACPIIVYWALQELRPFLFGTVEARIHQITPAGVSFMRAYVAMQVVGVLVVLAEASKVNLNNLNNAATGKATRAALQAHLFNLGHHFFSLVAFFGGLATGRLRTFACVLGLTEVSTIFLNLLLFCKHEDFKDWATQNTPWLLPFAGICLWLSFIVFRLILIPYVVYTMCSDTTHPAFAVVSLAETVYYPSVGVFLFILSAMWFSKIHAGMIKQLKLIMGGKTEGDKK